MKLKRALILLCLSLVTFALHADGTFTSFTVRPAQKGVADAKSATEFPIYLKKCNFSSGDSLTKVKRFYGIDSEPYTSESKAKYKGATAYTYHFDQYGVWVFFDINKKVINVRFNRPFVGTVAGIAIGDSSDQIVKLNGKPIKINEQGLYDFDEYRKRGIEIDTLLKSLPDLVPKARVLQVVEKIQAINSQELVRTASWRYKSDSSNSIRYHVSPVDNKVRYMFTGSCNSKVIQ